MTQTPIDRAYTEMEAAPSDDVARLRYFECLAESELFILLTKETDGNALSPEIFDLGDARYVLVFDREDRLSSFVGKPAPYAALSGRAIAQMLSGQDIGLGVNLDTAVSQNLIPPEAVAWLDETLQHRPAEVEAVAKEVFAPVGIPEALLGALDKKLATARGLARMAYLVKASFEDGGSGHLLGFVGTRNGAEGSLSRAVHEALTFSGIEAAALDVGFFESTDPMAAAMAKVGLRFELPQIEEPQSIKPVAPGSDPAKPPKLR